MCRQLPSLELKNVRRIDFCPARGLVFKRCSRRNVANFLRKSILLLWVYLNERSRIDFIVVPIVSVHFLAQTLCRKMRANAMSAGTARICDKSLESSPTRDEAETLPSKN
jgi:hypothetical protein